jgi:hypothetical protein
VAVSSGFDHFEHAGRARNVPFLGRYLAFGVTDWTRCRTAAAGSNLTRCSFLCFPAQPIPEIHGRSLDDTKMRGAQKHPFLHLLLNHQFRQPIQKSFLFLFPSLLCGIHALAPVIKTRSLDQSRCHSLTDNPALLLLTFFLQLLPCKS